MIAPAAAHRVAEESAFLLGQADPLRAAQILAKAVRHQSPGAKASLIRVLATTLAEHEPGLLAIVRADLATTTKQGD